MTSGPITSCQIDGETMEAVTDLIFLGWKIIADGDSSHEIKRHLLLGRKAMTNIRQHIKKQRRYLANAGPSSQSYGFPLVMDGYTSWTIKKAQHQRMMLLNRGVGEDS